MRIRRDLNSIPCQTASETWHQIVALVTGPGSRDVQQLHGASGVLASIITDEHPSSRAIMIVGVGPQLRIYCRYGMKAVEKGGEADALTWNPTAGDWTMHVPCDAENIEWVKTSLAQTSPRIKVFDVAEADRAEEDTVPTKSSGVVVDWNLRG
jgi:hypothetical protein